MNAMQQVSLEPQPMQLIVTVEQAAVRLADEGIPVRAIARSLKTPSDEVYDILKEAILTGTLLELPVDDWPPGSKRNKRAALQGTPLEDDETFQFACARVFKVTRLEIALLSVLLKRSQATKEQLHSAAKQSRAGEPQEDTEPKLVDVVICHMRKKLKPHKIAIETVWGIGYLISASHRALALDLLQASALESNRV